jgi:uncharacterized membrane protein SirB2
MSTLKLFHLTFVTLSGSGFLLRGITLLLAPHWPAPRWVRSVPHVNDTLLLATGVTLAVQIGWNPLHHPWLAAKLSALLVYIGLGMLTLRTRRTGVRIAALLAALVTFAYMVAVALTKQPLPL